MPVRRSGEEGGTHGTVADGTKGHKRQRDSHTVLHMLRRCVGFSWAKPSVTKSSTHLLMFLVLRSTCCLFEYFPARCARAHILLVSKNKKRVDSVWNRLFFVGRERLLAGFFDRHCNSHGHANHGVVTSADETHHFHVCRHGGGTSELGVGVHAAHGVGHAVRGRACSHVIGVEGTTCTTTRSHGEVLLTCEDAFLLVGTCDGVLEASGVGGVTGDGDVHAFLPHHCHAFAHVVGTVATDLGTRTIRERNFLDDVELAGEVIEFGFDVGEAVDTGDDVGCILTETVQADLEGFLTDLVGLHCDTDCTFSCCEGFVTCEEAEALGFFAEEHCAEVTVTEADLAIVSDGTGDAECLEAAGEVLLLVLML